MVTAVDQFFKDFGLAVVVDAGFRARKRHDNQASGRANRVVFLPGDPKSGAAGRLAPARDAGYRDVLDPNDPARPIASVRSLGEWQRDLIVSIWAYDVDRRDSDFAQVVAAEELLEWTKRAVDSVALADVVEWGSASWVLDNGIERAFGAELLVALSWTHPLFDVPLERAYPEFAEVQPATEDP